MRWYAKIGQRVWPREIIPGWLWGGWFRGGWFWAMPREPQRVSAAREAMPAIASGILDRRQVRLRRD